MFGNVENLSTVTLYRVLTCGDKRDHCHLIRSLLRKKTLVKSEKFAKKESNFLGHFRYFAKMQKRRLSFQH